ncbi:MAG: ketoacyl-ACP synthase III [Spirochaetales bacterium]|jgi:3-oxoacyl-[acyl-carrier-protein] synthase-3|nr:ketoacyl-ACP synthase III [Spirochaetales bacterium]
MEQFASQAVTIEAIGAYVPKKRVTNDELAEIVDTSDQWIRSHTGIGARHLADDNTATSDLAVEAAKDALNKSGIPPAEVDGIIIATATSDYVGFPSTACIVQDKLGLNGIPAFDITAGCTGFIYALEVAKCLILGGAMNTVLVIGAEKLSSIVNWEDRNTCVLFGDGAGCAVLKRTPETNRGIRRTTLYADGSGSECLIVRNGGSQNPVRSGDVDIKDVTLSMEGRKVYNFAVQTMVDTIRQLLDKEQLTIDDIDVIVPHQANSRIIQAAAKRLKFPIEKFFLNIEDYANTSAASIPIALKDLEEAGRLKKGNTVITVGFGAGLTSGGNLIVW